MRVLILGAKGMLGQELVHAFRGMDVLACDRATGEGHSNILENVGMSMGFDVTNAEAVRTCVTRFRPDVLMNAVALNTVDAIETHPSPAFAVNGDAVGFLAEAAAGIGAIFVHYSTDYVFDGNVLSQMTRDQSPRDRCPHTDDADTRIGYTEDDEPNPINEYGRSKFAGERALLEVAARHPGWQWYLIRTSRLFGRPASSPGAKQSFVDTMVGLSRKRDRLELIDEEVSSPTYAPDLAEVTRELIERPQGSSPMTPGVYHRTNDGSCTWYGFAKEIFRITGWRGTFVPVPASRFPRPAPRPAYSVLRTTKLPPMRRWEEALREYLAGSKSEIQNPKLETNPIDPMLKL